MEPPLFIACRRFLILELVKKDENLFMSPEARQVLMGRILRRFGAKWNCFIGN